MTSGQTFRACLGFRSFVLVLLSLKWPLIKGSTGYFLSDSSLTTFGLTGTLNILNASVNDPLGDDIPSLALNISFCSDDSVRILITDANTNNNRWQVPDSIVPAGMPQVDPVAKAYDLTYTESPFSLKLTRKADGNVLFALAPLLVFKDQFIEFSNIGLNPDARLFGLGEETRRSGLHLEKGSVSTLWNRDKPSLNFHANLYGSHPIYYSLDPDGTATGGFLRSSNGMDVYYSTSGDALTFKVVGGVIDLFVFNGPTPRAVISQYTSVVGLPAMMPYWSLGFHQCRYGYTGLNQVEWVRGNFSAASLPLDTLWMDIDYMDKWRDFTFDPLAFPEDQVRMFADSLHDSGQRLTLIVDPGILAVDPSWGIDYPPYEQGLEMGVFVTDGFTGAPYMTQVWPGPTHMPDFFHPNTSAYWAQQLSSFHALVPFDGLWVDMNEVSNFCNLDGRGQVCANARPAECPTASEGSATKCCLECSTVDPSDRWDFPPYNVGNGRAHRVLHEPLSKRTLPMSALHHGGLREYDVHNLFGLMEARATAEALAPLVQERPFVLSRSTFPGHGAHAAHWTGDNAAEWADLRAATVGVLNMGLFGIPMVGSDMCGFMGTTTEELCARWMALGAFHPFSRNHNDIHSPPQEPYLWPSVATATRGALGLRYRLLPHLYTLLFEASGSGAPLARPLWLHFSADRATHGNDEQFLLGASLLVSPALHQNQSTVDAYFPNPSLASASLASASLASASLASAQSVPLHRAAGGGIVGGGSGTWYALGPGAAGDASGADFVTGAAVLCAGRGGEKRSLETPLTAFNVHVASGAILPLHGGGGGSGGGYSPTTGAPLTTAAARALPYELLAVFDLQALGGGGDASATGSLFFDDGVQYPGLAASLRVEYAAAAGAGASASGSGSGASGSGGGSGWLSAAVREDGCPEARAATLGAITVLGLPQAPSGASLSLLPPNPASASSAPAAAGRGATSGGVPFTVSSIADGRATAVRFDLSAFSVPLNSGFLLEWTGGQKAAAYPP